MLNVVTDKYTCTECGFRGEFKHDLFDVNLQTICGCCNKLLHLVKVDADEQPLKKVKGHPYMCDVSIGKACTCGAERSDVNHG